MANVDNNGESALIAVRDDNGEPVYLKCDPITGELLIAIVSEAATENSGEIRVDGNTESVAFAVSDVDPDELHPLLCTPSGNLLIDLA